MHAAQQPDPRESSGRYRAEAFVAQTFHAINDVVRWLRAIQHAFAIFALAALVGLAWFAFNNYVLMRTVEALSSCRVFG